MNLYLCRVFDQYDPFVLRDEVGQYVGDRSLRGAGLDDDVHNVGLPQLIERLRGQDHGGVLLNELNDDSLTLQDASRSSWGHRW
jgi:hypothetical protein